MLALGNLIITPKKSKLCGLIFVVGGKTFFLPLKREKDSIHKLVAFEAENYLDSRISV